MPINTVFILVYISNKKRFKKYMLNSNSTGTKPQNFYLKYGK